MPANKQQTNLPESLKRKPEVKPEAPEDKPERKKPERSPVTKASSAVNAAVIELTKLKTQRINCESRLKELIAREAKAKDTVTKARAVYDRLTVIT